MATVFNEGAYPGDWLKAEQGHQLSRNTVTIEGLSSGTAVYESGLVLARRNSNGKWVPAANSGSDGVDQARGILLNTISMTTADKTAVIVDMGAARVSQNYLKWGPGITTGAHRDAAIAQLETNAKIRAVLAA